ncbi:MAG: threonine--tRNA ligase [Candidatus Parvarchaeum sp.]
MKIIYNGKEREFKDGEKAADIAKELNAPKDIIVAEINNRLIDLSAEVKEDGEIKFFTFNDDIGKKVFWHSSAHILAAAVKRLYPEAVLGIGPAIDEGFYYDIYNLKAGDNDLEDIEKEMYKIIKENQAFERRDISKKEAKELLKDNKFKLEIIEEVNGNLSIYKNGEFYDLCRGPHIPSTGYIGAVKLLKTSGAYWRGDSKREVMTRIYGISFPSKKELDEYIKFLEEKDKHDNKRIGKELELFEFMDVSPGSPFMLPKGTIIYNELIKLAREYDTKYDYKEIITPMIAKIDLWKISGHFDKYKQNMFEVKPFESDEEYALKPMSCPFHVLVFKSKTRSYKELPLRFAEHGLVHRYELEGTLNGLMRTRLLQQNDSHIFVTGEQIEDEIIFELKELKEIYDIFNLSPIFTVATRPDERIGEDELWDKAETALFNALKKGGYKYTIKPKDGAFYGPKIDVYVLDFTGKPESAYAVSTIQVDFNLARRFDATYVGPDNKEHIPVVLHRSILGSFGRFMGIILENSEGKLPVWLSPVQVKVLTITERNNKYADEIIRKLKDNGIRVESDTENGTLDYRIRKAQLEKVPFMIIIGDKEEEKKTIAVRNRNGKTRYNVDINEFINDILNNIKNRTKYEEE